MANRKTTGAKGNRKKNRKKNSSDDTLKFLLVLVIVGLIVAIILLMRETGTEPRGDATPTPTSAAEPSDTSKPTDAPDQSPTPKPTGEAAPTDTPDPTSVPDQSPTPELTKQPETTPGAVMNYSASDAEKLVRQTIPGEYTVQLLNENLLIGNWEYYQFCALNAKKEILYPFLVVNKQDGILYCYDSAEEVVFDFTEFPLKDNAEPTPEPTPELRRELTAEEAYQILCGYSKESLNIAKEVMEYQAEYDSELTFINGVNCYRFNLSEVTSDGKVRNRGEFYISTDGTECYYIDSETNEFVLAVNR